MPNLDENLENVNQRTGSSGGNLSTVEDRRRFQTNVRIDIASIMNQMNVVYKPLLEALSKEVGIDALDLGLSGNVIFTHIGATAADATAYWDSQLNRTRTVKETVDVLLSEIGRIENLVSSIEPAGVAAPVAETDRITNNELNLRQLRKDSMGPAYSFDNDGLPDLTHPLSQHIDALGAFFSGFPGTGNAGFTTSYPALSLNILLSDITIDTTLAQSTIDDLPTDLSSIRAFIGMDTVGPETPTYSAHGPVVIVSDGDTLEEAIQKLDEFVDSNDLEIWDKTGSVVSNTGPDSDVATDDWVVGSSSLDDDGVNDNRAQFDKSKGAFRAGAATGTEWDDANRGIASAAFGLNNTAAAIGSTAAGGAGNTIDSASLGSFIATGLTCSITSSDYSFIGTGRENEINSSASSAIVAGGINAGGNKNTINDSNYAFIGAGLINHIHETSNGAFIGAGVSNVVGTSGSGFAAAQSAIVAGNGNKINTSVVNSTSSFIGGGQLNTINDSSTSAIVGGSSNSITGISGTSLGNIIGGGLGNSIGDGVVSMRGAGIFSGLTNSVFGGANPAVIVGGRTNVVDTSSDAIIGAGRSNTVLDNSDDSGIFCGNGSTIDASPQSFVGGGESHSIDNAAYATIPGGRENTVEADYGSASGFRSVANNYGAEVHASGYFATNGDAQGEELIWRGTTTDAAPTEIFLDGSSIQYIPDDSSSYILNVMLVARQTGGAAGTVGDSLYEEIKLGISRTAGTTAGMTGGSQTQIAAAAGAAGWVVAGGIDGGTQAVTITVTGELNKDISWVATARIVKVSG
jgi:hypothetical protein